MSKNICVLTGARDSGMCKIYGYLRENGINITGFHERCDLIDDSEAIMSESDSVITEGQSWMLPDLSVQRKTANESI